KVILVERLVSSLASSARVSVDPSTVKSPQVNKTIARLVSKVFFPCLIEVSPCTGIQRRDARNKLFMHDLLSRKLSRERLRRRARNFCAIPLFFYPWHRVSSFLVFDCIFRGTGPARVLYHKSAGEFI